MDIPSTIAGKFLINEQSGCWEWLMSLDPDGYGQIKVNGKVYRAHRWAYMQLVGSIPEGNQLDHRCRVRHCVNPAHLDPVDHSENQRRGVYARKEFCINGHAYLPENLRVDERGRRRCRQCERDKYRRYNAKRPRG